MSNTFKEKVIGQDVHYVGKSACIEMVVRWIATSMRHKWLACANPYSLVLALDDTEFDKALKSADMVIPDGFGIVLASRLKRGNIRERVTGHDVFDGVCTAMNRQGGRTCFFLGSSEDTLEKIRQKMALDYPGFRIVGCFAPPFKDNFSAEDNRKMIDAVNAAHPDVLWVGMTAPKQEKWLAENIGKLDVGFAAAIGAVFDFYAGNVHRSHRWFRDHGLEWLPRLVQEPRRLWKRTFIYAPKFLFYAITGK